jgi:hypothetical protein
MNVPTTVSHTQADVGLKKGGDEKRDNDLTKERRGDVQEKAPGQEKCGDTLKIYFYKEGESAIQYLLIFLPHQVQL